MINQLIIFSAKYLYLLVIAITVLFFIKQPRDIQKQLLIFGIITLPAAYIIAKLAGFLYYDPRPFIQGGFTPLIPHAADNGFPSDHALLSAAISTAISPFNKKISVILWILTAIIGLSRVLAGIHHLIDIFGSIIISVIAGYLAYQIIEKKKTVEVK